MSTPNTARGAPVVVATKKTPKKRSNPVTAPRDRVMKQIKRLRLQKMIPIVVVAIIVMSFTGFLLFWKTTNRSRDFINSRDVVVDAVSRYLLLDIELPARIKNPNEFTFTFTASAPPSDGTPMLTLSWPDKNLDDDQGLILRCLLLCLTTASSPTVHTHKHTPTKRESTPASTQACTQACTQASTQASTQAYS